MECPIVYISSIKIHTTLLKFTICYNFTIINVEKKCSVCPRLEDRNCVYHLTMSMGRTLVGTIANGIFNGYTFQHC